MADFFADYYVFYTSYYFIHRHFGTFPKIHIKMTEPFQDFRYPPVTHSYCTEKHNFPNNENSALSLITNELTLFFIGLIF